MDNLNRRSIYYFFFAMGLMQAMQLGWFSQSIFIYASEFGFKIGAMVWVGLYALPYSLRFILAALTDFVAQYFNYAQGLRSMLLLLGLLWCLLSLCIGSVWFWYLNGILSLLCADLDTWIDAHRIHDYDKNLQNLLMQANAFGYRFGFGILNGVLLLGSHWISWKIYFSLIGLCSLVALFYPIVSTTVPNVVFIKEVKNILDYKILLSSIVMRSADAWINSLIICYLIYFHKWSKFAIGLNVQILGGLSGMLGVYLASKALQVFSLQIMLFHGLFLSAFFGIIWAFSIHFPPLFLNVLIVIWGLWFGFNSFLFSRWLVDNTSSALPSTHFSLMVSLARLPVVLSSAFGVMLMSYGDSRISFLLSIVWIFLSLFAQLMF